MRPGSSRTGTSLTLVALLAAVFALIVGAAGSASAHAGLSGSDPADGAVLTTAPQQVTLTFTESVGFSDDSLRVLSPANERVNPRPARHVDGKGNTGRVELPGGLPEGTYTVAWRVVSADGHPISGAFVFSVGKPSGTAAVLPAGSPDDTAVGRLYGLFRYVAYGGLALLVGVAAFVVVCWPAAGALRPVRRQLAAGWVMLVVATVALLLLRGPYETAGRLTSAFDLAGLGRTATGRPGGALIVRLVLLGAAAVAVKRSAVRFRRRDDDGEPQGLGSRARWAGAALALGLALTWAAAEHASAGIQVPLAVPAAVLHLLAMGVWLGGLITLVPLLRNRGDGSPAIPASTTGRFSALAFTAVVVLSGTGVYQSWRQVGSWGALTGTPYGKTLMVKVAAVVLVLCVASLSRRWTAGLVRQSPAAQTPAVPVPVPVRELVGAPSAAGAADPVRRSGSETTGVAGTDGGDTGRPVPEADALRRRLRRTVIVEALLGVAVLAVTTVLTGTQPSRAAATTAAAAAGQEPPVQVVTVPFDMGTANHQGTVQITLAPGRVGENTAEAVVFTADGGLATVPELRLTLTQEKLGVGPLDAGLKNRKGYWAAYDLRLPMPGEWTVNVTVRTSEIDQVTVHGTVRITSPS
ncbi:copper resistance CopC/CopD family protein [Streptomyces sp. NPDC056387]|uniref:copper resistance CopC/CopD family protein n=1 Tax=Streptomyces sp. NPDC056387 TaxID=3345803 RepID=UPI0035DF34F5